MPSVTKSGPSLFLGLELATDQLRASIVDESLELVGVECVDFDSELSEYQCVSSFLCHSVFYIPSYSVLD
jgi:xylulokinase